MGLKKDDWFFVEGMLRKTIPKYELVNRIITFGFSSKTRRKLVELAGIRPGMTVLDAGCGPGILSEMIAERMQEGRLFLLDPLDEMLWSAFRNLMKFDLEIEFVKGLMEEIPLPSNMFDLVVASYSIRDCMDRDRAIAEMKRVLKRGGRLMLLDITRPENGFDAIVSIHMKYIVPLLSSIAYRKRENPWKALYRTYVNMWTPSEMVKAVRRHLSVEFYRTFALGAFTLVSARK
ncbi:MAG: hypothetical protein C0200_02230 [Thermoproteota archaeon]|nr:MAG: hypothetical protein C0200_02230 [Candidatus Korarchaeota archaeon]